MFLFKFGICFVILCFEFQLKALFKGTKKEKQKEM